MEPNAVPVEPLRPDPTPRGPKRTTTAPHLAPCPVCGKLFTLRHIEQHADRCATQKFLDMPRGEGDAAPRPRPAGTILAKALSGGTARRPAKRIKKTTTMARGPIATPDGLVLHVALGNSNGQDDARPPSPQPSEKSSGCVDSAIGQAPARPRRAPKHVAQHQAKTWTIPGGEAIQFRNAPVIHVMALPNHLLERVRFIEDRMRHFPAEAVSVTTSKGTIDKKKSAELQRRIQEEEYQLELYRSTRPTRRPHPEIEATFFDTSTALIEAAEAPACPPRGCPNDDDDAAADAASATTTTKVEDRVSRLLMRVRVSNTGFHCEHSMNGSLFATSETAAPLADPPSECCTETSETPPDGNARGSSEGGLMPLPDTNEKDALPRRRPANSQAAASKRTAPAGTTVTARDANGNRIITKNSGSVVQKTSRKKRSRSLARKPTNQDALEFVNQMRHVFNVPPAIITEFVGLLKSYKSKTISADEVARHIADLLKDYPDLVVDFDKFLPLPHDAKIGGVDASRVLGTKERKKRRQKRGTQDADDTPPEDPQGAEAEQSAEGMEPYYSDEMSYFEYYGYHPIGGPEWPPQYATMAANADRRCDGDSNERRAEHFEAAKAATAAAIAQANEADEHRNELEPGIYWRPFDYEDAYASVDPGGFARGEEDDGGQTKSQSEFVGADVWQYTPVKDNGDETTKVHNTAVEGAADCDVEPDTSQIEPTLTNLFVGEHNELEAKPPRSRCALEPNRDEFPPAPRAKVIAAVDEALKQLAQARPDGLGSAFRNDYEQMREVAYEVWERFKNDMYSFDAFAGIVLEANKTRGPPPLDALTSMLNRLKCLFNADAEDVLEKLIDVQCDETRQYLQKMRANWPKPQRAAC
ncbi:hypothetical protein CTAYLR_003161 [Chrysophaeum taylorii]|uniref:UBZ4-type domain-containing protein n=1 Tax=Chrysophaeum taylorii TaxID=2483200 RepID=A0AAD7XUD4_9STRA|nr:hypothetical protein CTAYLR_003161 [Chrysophaeum taylorii]